MDKQSINEIIKLFEKNYGEIKPFLNFNTVFQLLIAVVLSAQCTDKRVNLITKKLFKIYKTPSDLANIELKEFEEQIRTCGIFHTKAKNLIETAKILKTKFNDDVPDDFNSLISLPGIGRKSANIILGTFYNKDTFPVDTHVFRVANRIGLANANNVEKTENELTETIEPKLWMKMHRWLILHGRTYCVARNPKCSICFLQNYCAYFKRLKT